MGDTHGIDLYAGGLYQAGGVYRPNHNSRMRYNAPDFNGPSRAQLGQSLCRASWSWGEPTAEAPPPDGWVFGDGFERAYTVVDTPCQ